MHPQLGGYVCWGFNLHVGPPLDYNAKYYGENLSDCRQIMFGIFIMMVSFIFLIYYIYFCNWQNHLFCVHAIGWMCSPPCSDTMSTISPTDFDSLEIQQQYNDINNRWDLAAETDWDNENSSARLFERSRIKALAGRLRSRHPECSIITTMQPWSSHLC